MSKGKGGNSPVEEPPLPDEASALDAGSLDDRSRELFARAADDAAARDELVQMYYPLVEYLARRFRGRGEPLDDLIQVASIGLLKAIDRFEPERGVKFSTYATPTIIGEVKRHFRDKGWAMRVPRRLQEIGLQLRGVIADAYQELGRSPTIGEIAERSNLSEEEVLEGLDTVHAYSMASLDAPADEEGRPALHNIGVEDETFEMLEGWANVAPLLRQLPERERLILYYRFVRGMTQSEIATELGMSQMHVSRLLARTLRTLREGVGSVQEEPSRRL
jgi:RNA polymerase sigma-B factor